MVKGVHRKSRRWEVLHPHTFLMTQIRNVLQKWHPGNSVFILTSQKTEIAKYACEPRLQGLLAEVAQAKQYLEQTKFGDLITADHKVLDEEGESRNNHRYAVVVQDLAAWWIQFFPCKTKTSQETEKSLRKFLEPSEKPKVIYIDNSLEFGKSCEEFSWNHRTSTPHRSETNGVAERAVRRVREGTSAVLLQSGLDEKWWADSMECCCYLRNVQDLLADRKTPCERRFGEPYEGPANPFWDGWNSIRFLHETSQGSTNLASMFSRNIPRICMNRWGIWKGDILVAGSEDLEHMDAAEIHPRRIDAEEVLTPQRREDVICPIADGTAKLSEGDHEFREPALRRKQPVWSEDLCGELQGEPEDPQPTETKDDAEARADLWSIQFYLSSSHWSSSSTLCAERRKHSFLHLKYIDVTRASYTNLDVLQEKRVDDYWNVDANRSLSGSWKGFTKFTPLKEKPPKGFVWSRERPTKIQATTRPENLWPEVWTKMGNAAQKEKSKNGQTKSPNSTMLWISRNHQQRKGKVGSFDGGGNALQKRNREALWVSGNGSEELWIQQDSKNRSMHASCMAHESTRQRFESSPLKDHEDHISGKDTYFDDTFQFGAQVYSYASSDENSGRASSSGQGMEKSWMRILRGSWVKFKAKRRLFS